MRLSIQGMASLVGPRQIINAPGGNPPGLRLRTWKALANPTSSTGAASLLPEDCALLRRGRNETGGESSLVGGPVDIERRCQRGGC